MEILQCTSEHVSILAQMNSELFQDEQNDRIPPIAELERRLSVALNTDSNAFFFLEEMEIVGYALVRVTSDPFYLTHFYISRNKRRNGLGTKAIDLLLRHLKVGTLDLDVFCWNEVGQAFWRSLGFQERCYIMRLNR